MNTFTIAARDYKALHSAACARSAEAFNSLTAVLEEHEVLLMLIGEHSDDPKTIDVLVEVGRRIAQGGGERADAEAAVLGGG